MTMIRFPNPVRPDAGIPDEERYSLEVLCAGWNPALALLADALRAEQPAADEVELKRAWA